jgi:GNAT superfamily N-acetyltransferase
MNITRNDRIRMERAHVHAWPALRTERIDGWLWRSSGGGTQRGNSVSTVDFTGSDVDAAIGAVEARYGALGAEVRFQTFGESTPAGLPDALQARGYAAATPTVTMFRPPGTIAAPNGIEIRDAIWDEWLAVYLEAITENRRAINQVILGHIPAPRAFFGYRRDGRIVATALCVVSNGCAVIECVATRLDARRQGAARAVLAGLLDWASRQDADLIGLQAVAENTPAIRLYESLGFVAGSTNWYWTRP